MYKQELRLMVEEEPKTAEIQYRQARAEDLPEMTDLFLEVPSDLGARTNVTAALPPRPAVLLSYEHILSTGISHLAQLDGQITAVAGAVVRDHLWFLSAFWARPDLQRQRIGMPLLRRGWNAGLEAGATIFCTWSSVDPTAMAAYMKLGMLPAYQILHFEGTLQKLPAVSSAYSLAALEKPQVMDLDGAIRGARRQADHDLWCDRAGLHGRQVLRDGTVCGYYYLGQGSICPATWRKPQNGEAVLTKALQEATATATQIRFSVPGINHAALRCAFDSGLRLTGSAHLLTSAAFGRLERYLPSGPSLF